MRRIRLFENFDRITNQFVLGLSENWETEISDIIKSDFRDLENDADNISKGDIDEVIQAHGRKHGEPDANYVDIFNFIGTYFGMEMKEIDDMLEMGEAKKSDRK